MTFEVIIEDVLTKDWKKRCLARFFLYEKFKNEENFVEKFKFSIIMKLCFFFLAKHDMYESRDERRDEKKYLVKKIF